MPKQSSVRDVARVAGVSIATVSRVLSSSSYPIRQETRDRVLEGAKLLDFRPNMVARALVTARTRTVGAIVHDVSDPYFGEILRGLEDEARSAGYQLFVCSSCREVDRELAYVRALLSHRVDAIVFAAGAIEQRNYQYALGQLLNRFRDNGGHVVMLAPHAYRAPRVVLDNRGGAVAMTRHLVELGHRKIGFIDGPGDVRTSAIRRDGYRSTLAGCGLHVSEDMVVAGNFTWEGGAQAISRLLTRRPDLTAVFAANDIMAFGALSELARRGIRVPEQISIAGFDNVRMAALVHPSLTTVAAPMYEMGQEGIRTALALLAGRHVRSRRLPVSVVQRESTAPPNDVRGHPAALRVAFEQRESTRQ